MKDKLYIEQLNLENEMRHNSISKFLKEHLEGDFSESQVGSMLLKNYIIPFTQSIKDFVVETKTGKAGPRNRAGSLLEELKPEVASYLFTKAILNRVGVRIKDRECSLVGLAIYGAGLLHDELRITEFETENKKWFDYIWADFNKRELPRYKREEYLQKVFRDSEMEWRKWSKGDMLHVGTKLIELFKNTTGDLEIITKRTRKKTTNIVKPSEGLLKVIESIMGDREGLCTTFYPMIVKPVPWSSENLSRGSYHSHHVTHYPLVKSSKASYRRLLKQKVDDGELDHVLRAVNAIQDTPWRINTQALDALQYVYDNNIECGKLPRSDSKDFDPPPTELEGLPYDHQKVKEYRAYRATIHEYNRRSIGKRVMAIRALQAATKFSKYDEIYFPHDLDSRGRAYPKPSIISPQGPDYVKGLLEFADGKPLGDDGMFWLGVHGANCYGEDKLPIFDRHYWSWTHIDMIKAIAADPKGNLEWTKADSPVMFLAFCIEYAEAFNNSHKYISHLHVDLDATCSGLQHFSGMLRDEVGGFHVNMTPNPVRQDVYGAVAQEALKVFESDLQGDRAGMAKAWIDSSMMDRNVTKRPVMVKPYAATRQSCSAYVRDAVDEKLTKGYPSPWSEDDMFNFKMYGAEAVWEAIPKVVVAADGAMSWLSQIARLVGKSQPEDKRIEWETPIGFPVHQYKFDLRRRKINTHLDGSIYQPRYVEETDKLDPRKMASSVAPSFVHSMDAAHLQLTVSKALDVGITHFAMVHDSFGVHAADVSKFAPIIREAFVEMYSEHDVLQEFLESALPFISEELLSDVPPVPPKGNLDLNGVLKSEFFFS